MIRVQSIEISRFRRIRAGEVRDFTDVNMLVGRNNSGKSTVAEAISRVAFVLAHGNARDPIGRPPTTVWDNARRNPGPPSPEGWFKQDQTQTLSLTIRIDGVSCCDSFSLRAGSLAHETTVQPEIRNEDNHPVNQFARRLSIFRPLDAIDQQIENALWPQLLAKRRDKALTKALNEIFRMDIEQLQVLPDKRLLLLFPDYTLPLDVQGDGARAAMRCLMFTSALQGTLLILEEPECHQHPGSLERFALAVCRLAREQEVQLLISTHSGECVNAFLKAAKQVGSESAVFHLKLQSGDLHARRLEPITIETLQSTGVDVRQLDLYA